MGDSPFLEFCSPKGGVNGWQLRWCSKRTASLSLFETVPTHGDGLMAAIDKINARYGHGCLGLGLAGKDQERGMRRENLSPSFIIKWADLGQMALFPSCKSNFLFQQVHLFG